MQLKCKNKKIVQHVEKALQLTERAKSVLWGFVLQVSRWTKLHQPKPGGPADVDSNQTETSIDSNQRSTTWEIANILKISKSRKLLVKMKNVSFILQKKLNRVFGQPNILLMFTIAHVFNIHWMSFEWQNARRFFYSLDKKHEYEFLLGRKCFTFTSMLMG